MFGSTTFTLEQNSAFKLKRNKNVKFIMIIINTVSTDMKNFIMIFLWPYRPALLAGNTDARWYLIKLYVSTQKFFQTVMYFSTVIILFSQCMCAIKSWGAHANNAGLNWTNLLIMYFSLSLWIIFLLYYK